MSRHITISTGRLPSEAAFELAREAGFVRNCELPDPARQHARDTARLFDAFQSATDAFLRDWDAGHPNNGEQAVDALDPLFRRFAEWADTLNLHCWALEFGPYEHKSMRRHSLWRDVFVNHGRFSASFLRINHAVNRLKHHGGELMPIRLEILGKAYVHYAVKILRGNAFVPDRLKGTTQYENGIVSHELKEILFLVHYLSDRIANRIASSRGLLVPNDTAFRQRVDEISLKKLFAIPDLFFKTAKSVYGNTSYDLDDVNGRVIQDRRRPAGRIPSFQVGFTHRLPKKGDQIVMPYAYVPQRYED